MWVGWFVCAAALFWVLRVWYWGSVTEPLFADMEDYDRIAHGILARGEFGFDSFFRSYTAPTVPLMRAIQFALFGESLDSWRIFQGVILFSSLLWCAKEIVRVSGSRFAGLALVVSVAMSKPSIFWSFKYSREGIAEGFTYLTVATVLYAVRRRSGLSFFFAGIATMVGIFVRGSAIPLLGLLVAYFLFQAFLHRKHSRQARLFVLGSAAFLVGALVVWVPWVARSVALYGEPVFLTTQGSYAFV